MPRAFAYLRVSTPGQTTDTNLLWICLTCPQSLFYLDLCTGSLIIALLTTWFLVTPGAPHCRRWHEASGGATGARYAGTPTRLADKADVWTPPPAGVPMYSDVYLQVV